MLSTRGLPQLWPFAGIHVNANGLTRAFSRLGSIRTEVDQGFWIAMLASSDPEMLAMLYDEDDSSKLPEEKPQARP